MYFDDFRRLSMLLLLVERVAALPRARVLTFYSDADEPVGRISLDGGLIGIGVQVAGGVYMDEAFTRDASPVAPLLRKLLLGQALNVAEGLRLHNIPLIARRALCGVTARALRQIALHCDLTKIRIGEDADPPARSGEERPAYSVFDLLLAAGRVETLRAGDAAARLYETPPGSPEERWLFEWQPDAASGPWPIMTTRTAERRTNSVAQIGLLGQTLSQPLSQPRRAGQSITPTAAICLNEQHAYYTVVTEHYVVLLLYPVSQLDRLIKSLEDFVFAAGRGPATLAKPAQRPISEHSDAHHRHKRISLPPLLPHSASALHLRSALPRLNEAEQRIDVADGARQAAPTPRPAATAPPPMARLADEAREWLSAGRGLVPAELSAPVSTAPTPAPAADGRVAGALAAAVADGKAGEAAPGSPPAAPPIAELSGHETAALPMQAPPSSPPSLSLVAAAVTPTVSPFDSSSLRPTPVPAPPVPLLALSEFAVAVNGQPVIAPVSLQVAAHGLHLWVVDGGVQRRLLLRLLCGGHTAGLSVSGRALFAGQDLLGASSPGPHLPPRDTRALMMSAREYLLEGLPSGSGPHSGSRLPALLQQIEHAGFSDLLSQLDLRLCQLDPFQRRVLEVLRGARSAPRLLVQDDPLHGLSFRQQGRLRQLLRTEAERRAILILVGEPDLYSEPQSPCPLQISWLDVLAEPGVAVSQTGSFAAIPPLAESSQRRSQVTG